MHFHFRKTKNNSQFIHKIAVQSCLWHYHLSRHMTKPTKWSVCPVNTRISLGICLVWSHICPVWSRSSLCTLWVAKDWACSGWSEFAGCTGHFVGFVMPLLISVWWPERMYQMSRVASSDPWTVLEKSDLGLTNLESLNLPSVTLLDPTIVAAILER